jgi:hypothetical protein
MGNVHSTRSSQIVEIYSKKCLNLAQDRYYAKTRDVITSVFETPTRPNKHRDGTNERTTGK